MWEVLGFIYFSQPAPGRVPQGDGTFKNLRWEVWDLGLFGFQFFDNFTTRGSKVDFRGFGWEVVWKLYWCCLQPHLSNDPG